MFCPLLMSFGASTRTDYVHPAHRPPTSTWTCEWFHAALSSGQITLDSNGAYTILKR